MLALVALSLLADPAELVIRLSFEKLNLQEAQKLNGQAVTVTFQVMAPAYQLKGRTVTSPGDAAGLDRLRPPVRAAFPAHRGCTPAAHSAGPGGRHARIKSRMTAQIGS
jgi:hypothetical protein